jgi:hypothetical protein
VQARRAHAQHLAVDGEAFELADFLFQKPRGDDALEVGGFHSVEDPVKCRVAGHHIPVGLAVVIAPEGAELAAGHPLADVLKCLVTARPHQGRHCRAGQRAGGPMVQTVPVARVMQGAQSFVEAAQGSRQQRTGTGDFRFALLESCRKLRTGERFSRSGTKLPQVKRLGLPVLGVVIATVPCKSRARPHCLKPAGPITSAFEPAFVHKTFHHQNRIAPPLLPVGVQTPQTKAQHFGGQIGVALPLHEQ